MLQGCNLTGGDTLYTDWASLPVPVSGQHYLFVSTADIDICLKSGMNIFRLVFSWEAYETPVYKQTLHDRVNYITSKGAVCVLDIHPGDASLAPGYRGTKIPGIVAGKSVETRLAELWFGIASIYKSNPLVHFGIFNEPNGISSAVWFKSAQVVLNSIRASGSLNQVWMPGSGWSGAGTWVSTSGSAWNIVDPAGKTGVQVHMYYDANSGGGDSSIAASDIGVTRLKNTVDWARGKGLKVLLGEVALDAKVGAPAVAAWKATVDYMSANQDVVAGWCWWAYGPPAWWAGYRFTLCNNSPAMRMAFPQQVIVVPPPPPPDPKDVEIAALKAKVAALETQLAASQASWVDLSSKCSDLKSMVTFLQAKVEAAKLALA